VTSDHNDILMVLEVEILLQYLQVSQSAKHLLKERNLISF